MQESNRFDVRALFNQEFNYFTFIISVNSGNIQDRQTLVVYCIDIRSLFNQ